MGKNNNIPKTIHYCWFGRQPLPESTRKYIESWRRNCPNYKIIEWNEDNFDLSKHQFAKEAYEQGKWAFVSDYVRLYVLCNEGGIYLDTDVELIKSLDEFLGDQAFSGFESFDSIGTGVMGCKKGSKFFKAFYNCYKNKRFVLENGELAMTTNVVEMTNLCKSYGLIQNNTLQSVCDLTVYPREVFCPKSPETGKLEVTNNTVAIHHYSGSWLRDDRRKRLRLREKLYEKFGNGVGGALYRTVFVPYRVWTFVRARGVGQLLGFLKGRFKKQLCLVTMKGKNGK